MSFTISARSWLLRLYPSSWRERYGDEFAALLDECPLTPFTVFDIVLGALDAHIEPSDETGRILRMLQQTRRSAITVFCAWIAFVVAGLAFNQMIEDDVRQLNSAHPGVAIAYYVVMVAAVVALLAVLVGGLPIAFAALRRALAEGRRDVLLFFAVPPVALAVWLLWTWLLVNQIAPGNGAANGNVSLLFLSWIGLFVLAAIASTAAVSLAIARVEIAPRLFRFALAPATITTLAMVVMLGAVIAWGLVMRSEAPSYLSSPTGPAALRASVSVHLLVQIAVMMVATLLAVAALIRGLRAPGNASGAGTAAMGTA
jgi:hypothetical protein